MNEAVSAGAASHVEALQWVPPQVSFGRRMSRLARAKPLGTISLAVAVVIGVAASAARTMPRYIPPNVAPLNKDMVTDNLEPNILTQAALSFPALVRSLNPDW